MKKYKFLFKPLFFIFSLLFASWMVLAIEKIRPSDFGKYKSLFESNTNKQSKVKTANLYIKKKVNTFTKRHIMKFCFDYKAGEIDSTQLDQQLEQLLNIP
jgi:hypothetical protein